MIAFFRSLNPFKFIVLLFLLLAVRLPLIFMGIPLIEPELYWLLIGEKMKDGFSMYTDIWDTLAPLSAATYYLLSFFGKSQLVLQVASLLLVALHAAIFNFIANLHNIFKERTLIPALVYITVSSLFFDFYTLSPAMLSTTFILISFHYLLAQIRDVSSNEDMFYTGLVVGIASLFYLPAILFLLIIILALLFYSSPNLKFVLLLICGVLFPLLWVGVYYYWIDGLTSFLGNFIEAFVYVEPVHYMPLVQILLVLAVPAALTLSSMVYMSVSKYTNFQYNVMRIMIGWLAFAVLSLLIADQVAPFQLYIMVPPIAYFGVHFFILLTKPVWAESLFFALLVLVVAFTYGSYVLGFNKPLGLSYKIVSGKEPSTITGKHILVTGNDVSLYLNNSMATPYINWRVAERQLSALDNYYNVSLAYRNFKHDLPDVIVDEKGIIPQLFYRIPILEKEYTAEKGNVYVRKAQR